jgi:hypothetical protein
VHTKIIPPEMLAAVSPDCLTPVATIVAAYDDFLSESNSQTGQAIECSVEKHLVIPQQELMNGRYSKRAVTVWEPLFKISHGEISNLDDAIP